MVSKTVEFVFQVFLIVLLLAIGISYFSQIIAHAKTATGLTSNTTENPEEIVETTSHRPLEIKDTDSPDVIVYKLFKNFDPLFLNEIDDDRILYNVFTLELKGNVYGDGTAGHESIFIDKIREGLKGFNYVDEFYNIGVDLIPDCGSVKKNYNIDFSNDCWDFSSFFDRNPMTYNIDPGPCRIYVNGDNILHMFKWKVKIRVAWYKTTQKFNDKDVINTIVAICSQ